MRKSEKEILWAGDGSDDDEEAVLKRAADHVAAKPAPARTTKAHRRKLGGEEDDDDEDSEDEEEDDEEEEDDVGMLEGTVRELAGLLYTKYLLAQWMKVRVLQTAWLLADHQQAALTVCVWATCRPAFAVHLWHHCLPARLPVVLHGPASARAHALPRQHSGRLRVAAGEPRADG